MYRNVAFLLATLSLASMLSSCERIQQRAPTDFGPEMDNIPLEYGRLVSTVSVSDFVSILWFEQADQSLVGVRVNTARGSISEAVIRIERK